jgi:hypothetical protein
MSETTKQKWREEQAKREIGHTDFSPGVALFLMVSFLVAIVSVPVIQLGIAVHERMKTGRAPSAQFLGRLPAVLPEIRMAWHSAATSSERWLNANAALMKGIDRFEMGLDDSCFLTHLTVAPVQELMCRLGVGNEKAFVGHDGWLFFEPGVSYLTGPGFLDANRMRRRLRTECSKTHILQPDPVLAILHMQLQLARRGIRLVVVPAAVKPSVHPEKLNRRTSTAAPLQNGSFERFVEELNHPRSFMDGRLSEWARHGAGLPANAWRDYEEELRKGLPLLEQYPVIVFDPAPLLVARKQQTGNGQFLVTDTHWTPDAMQNVVTALAAVIREEVDLPTVVPSTMQSSRVEIASIGDIAGMLKLREDQALFEAERVAIRQILQGRHLWRPDPASPVLLLGDSFSNVYSLNGMGWGESAGVAEQLSYELGFSIDAMVRNDAGAHATRGMLSGELQKWRDRLAGKQVVIYEFAARELAVGDWKMLDLDLGEVRRSDFFVPNAGEIVEVEGVVSSVTSAPRPGSVPYRDHVVAVHLVDITSSHLAAQNGEALVYMMSMKDKAWLPPARYRLGERLRLRLRAWSDVESTYGRLNRAEPEQEALMFEEPCWGEER